MYLFWESSRLDPIQVLSSLHVRPLVYYSSNLHSTFRVPHRDTFRVTSDTTLPTLGSMRWGSGGEDVVTIGTRPVVGIYRLILLVVDGTDGTC